LYDDKKTKKNWLVSIDDRWSGGKHGIIVHTLEAYNAGGVA